MHCVIGRSCVQYQVGTIPNLQVELPTGQIFTVQNCAFKNPACVNRSVHDILNSCFDVWHSESFFTIMLQVYMYMYEDDKMVRVSRLFIYNKDNIIQDEKRQYKAQCWSNVTQQMCHVKEFWDKQSRYFTYTNQTSVYFNRLMCINSLQIFKTKKDIPKRKMPSFCNLKDLSKKQQLFFIS